MYVCGLGEGKGVRLSGGRKEANVNLNMLDAVMKHSQSTLSSSLPSN